MAVETSWRKPGSYWVGHGGHGPRFQNGANARNLAEVGIIDVAPVPDIRIINEHKIFNNFGDLRLVQVISIKVCACRTCHFAKYT